MDKGTTASFNATHGAETLSSFLSAALFGFTFLQSYTYFLYRSSHDSPLLKLAIALLWAVDFLQVLFLVWAVYWYLVQNFFEPSALYFLHWPITVTWFMASAGSFIAELCFVPQIWSLSQRNKPLTGLIAVMSLAQYAASIVVFANMVSHLNVDIAAAMKNTNIPIILQQVFAIISNNVIAIAFCLYNYNPSEGIFGSSSRLDGILVILFDYALISGVLQVVYLVVYLCESKSPLWFPFHVATSKLLVNSILAKLNARDLQADNEKRVGLNLSHLGARTTVMPMTDRVMVVTTTKQTIVETDTQSTSSTKDDLERQR